ncbi:riboflavin synthase [Oscillospiraceae bacterium CM]|nr:riboflavin synthase [Oscillospiraceae bacterium CM]
MFTGIIEEIGTVTAVAKDARASRLSIRAAAVFGDLKLGDSVAVNGVCLTVSDFGGSVFTADVMHETLDRTNLGALVPGRRVNLERAMSASGRFGGHMVSGHIDGTGRIIATRRDGSAVWVIVSAPPAILRYIVEKGSIAIDGISLTVARVTARDFSVSLIPHTGQATTLLDRHIGETVNLENDMIGKYVERFVTAGQAPQAAGGSVTRDFLMRTGF